MREFPTRMPYSYLSLYYDTMNVERRYERLLYDTPGFLSALGGSLGLYLGLSVLGAIFGALEAAQGAAKVRRIGKKLTPRKHQNEELI